MVAPYKNKRIQHISVESSRVSYQIICIILHFDLNLNTTGELKFHQRVNGLSG